jgi:dienelactone hydrolase
MLSYRRATLDKVLEKLRGLLPEGAVNGQTGGHTMPALPRGIITAVTLGGGLLLLAAGCSRQGPSPGLELQHEDYARARSGFKTKLVRSGPAPQKGEALHAPPGAQQVTVRSGDLQLTAWVGPVPAGGGKSPAVLFLHGGFALGQDDWEQTRPYRDAGFIVMALALRGENGQPGSYSMFYDEVDDSLAAADHLASLPYVDTGHLYVAGHSVGGTLTLLAALASPRFQGAASFSGSSDQIAWSRGQMDLVPFDPKDVLEFRMRSPIAYATGFRCPVRIYYGSQESLFAGMSQETAKLAKGANLDVEAVSVPGDHFSSVPAAMQKSIEFFKQKR